MKLIGAARSGTESQARCRDERPNARHSAADAASWVARNLNRTDYGEVDLAIDRLRWRPRVMARIVSRGVV